MATEFQLPELGEGVDSAVVARVLVSEGDSIEADDHVLELETEKAVAELPCPHSGKVSELHVSKGDTIKVGQKLMTIDEKGESGEEQTEEEAAAKEEQEEKPSGADQEQKEEATAEQEEKKETKKKKQDKKEKEAAAEQQPAEEGEQEPDEKEKAGEKPDKEEAEERKQQATEEEGPTEEGEEDEAPEGEETAEDHEQQHEEPQAAEEQEELGAEKKERPEKREKAEGEREDGRPPPAGPATRQLARKLEIDLDDLQPPEGGRIRQEHVVRAYLESGKAAALAASAPPLPDFSEHGPTERQSLGKIAQVAQERLSRSWKTIPHVTQHDQANIIELEKARREYNERAGQSAAKITLTAIMVKTMASLLREFPKFNSSFDAKSTELVFKHYYHIGVAVDTEEGLVVPVIRNVDRKSIQEIAAELSELASRARRRQLKRGDMEGATFTVSNQGGIGGGHFTPIINYPEVAILGIASARSELQMVEGKPQEQLILPFSLSYDHRVINGADAVRFTQQIAHVLSDAFTLLVEA